MWKLLNILCFVILTLAVIKLSAKGTLFLSFFFFFLDRDILLYEYFSIDMNPFISGIGYLYLYIAIFHLALLCDDLAQIPIWFDEE